MSLWTYIRPNRLNLRRQLFALGSLLALTAIAGAVVLKPSRHKPDTWDNLKKDLAKRAQLDLFDDFQSGLDGWDSIENLATWSYDNGGLAIPGKLSVLTASKQLTDYNVDAVAQVVNRGFGVVFRASGARTYQVAKLIVDGKGPMPPLFIQRYSVIGGKESARVRVRCPGTFQKDTLYHIHLDVHGDSYTLFIEGQLIDSWSDSRTKSGGVGFFCASGEKARLAWIRVTHNNDAAGRLCAFVSSLL
jgi:hypothetical protein